jgi:hypothetical protein
MYFLRNEDIFFIIPMKTLFNSADSTKSKCCHKRVSESRSFTINGLPKAAGIFVEKSAKKNVDPSSFKKTFLDTSDFIRIEPENTSSLQEER